MAAWGREDYTTGGCQMATNVTNFEDRLASDDRWFVRVNEGARLTGVSPKTIYAGIYSGTLAARCCRMLPVVLWPMPWQAIRSPTLKSVTLLPTLTTSPEEL